MTNLQLIEKAISIGEDHANFEFEKAISNEKYLEFMGAIYQLMDNNLDSIQNDIYSAYLFAHNIKLHLLKTNNWVTRGIVICQTDLESIKNKYTIK